MVLLGVDDGAAPDPELLARRPARTGTNNPAATLAGRTGVIINDDTAASHTQPKTQLRIDWARRDCPRDVTVVVVRIVVRVVAGLSVHARRGIIDRPRVVRVTEVLGCMPVLAR